MNWIIKTLVGAALAGVGLKIGSDVYEMAKKGVQSVTGAKPTGPETGEGAKDSEDADLEGAIETEIVELDQAEGR